MKMIKNCYDLYLKRNLFLLAEVKEKFKNNSLKIFGLCPSHYLSEYALIWDAMLNMTKLSLNLFQMLTCIYCLKKG